MSPNAGQLLVDTIAPSIRRAIAGGTARTVGAEDREELTADCIAQAAKILHAGERNGKKFPAKSVVYHALQRTKYGQRGRNKSVTDVMAPRTQFKGRSRLVSMEEILPAVDTDTEAQQTLHDVLAAPREDVACTAGRRIDWREVTHGMDALQVDTLCSLADGRYAREVAEDHDISPFQVAELRRSVKGQIRSQWGQSIIGEFTQDPMWKRQTRAHKQRSACRRERAAV